MSTVLETIGDSLAWMSPQHKRIVIIGDRRFAIVDGKVFWSTTDAGWVNLSADIHGWSEGSIAAYQDTGGTWRLVSTWRQLGTLDGRNDLLCYVAVGTFSPDLSTLSWGPAIIISLDGRTPDVDVVADGSGGLALMAWHDAAGFLHLQALTVSSAGGMTAQPAVTGSWLVAAPSGFPGDGSAPNPSVAIDPVSKHAGVSYSASFTSFPNEIRFQKGTYAAGTWAWGTIPRLISDSFASRYAGYDTSFVTCRWDPFYSGWVIGGPLLRNDSSEATTLWFRPLADNATYTLFTGAVDVDARQSAGTFVVDPTTGDIYLVGAHHTSLGHPASLRTRHLVRNGPGGAMVDGGFTTIDTSTAVSGVNAFAEAGSIHLLYEIGTTTPWSIEYARLGINRPPDAPVLLSPTAGISIDVAQGQTFSLTFSDPDPGDALAALQIRYRIVGDSSWTTGSWIVTTAGRTLFAGSTFGTHNYEWQARTKDQLGAVGPWSASGFFTGVGITGVPIIISPANGQTVGPRVDLEWSETDQDSWQARVLASDLTTVVEDTGEQFLPDEHRTTLTFENSDVALYLQIRARFSGVWSDWATVAVTTSFALPGQATAAVAWLAWIAGALVVTTRHELAIGYRVLITNEAGDSDPALPDVSPTPIEAIDFGGPGGDFT